jgi:PAS domain S-box-containing protein
LVTTLLRWYDATGGLRGVRTITEHEAQDEHLLDEAEVLPGPSAHSRPESNSRDRSTDLLIEQSRLLEAIASGCALDECLTEITAAVSRLEPGTRACVLLADGARGRFEGGFSATVAPEFAENVAGAAIEELAIGTCGTAVFRGEPVSCPDVRHDERWAKPWRDLCTSNGIFACHSEPVIGEKGGAIASVMMCFDRPREPTQWEREIARFAAHVASVAIERDRSSKALNGSEERYRKLFHVSQDAIFLLDPEGNAVLDVNPAGVKMFGYNSREELLATPLAEFHPRDLDRFLGFVRSVHEEGAGWTDEFACRAKDGRFLTSEISASSIVLDGRQCLLAAVRDASERKKAEKELRDSEAKLQTELDDARRLQTISTALIRQDGVDSLYRKVLDAAAGIMRADFASMQMFDSERGQLQLLAHKNFPDAAAAFWEWVDAGEGSTCGQALASGQRSIVPDTESCAFMIGTEDFEFYRSSGMRAVQSTPLVGRDGRVVGMISTHWKEPHQPSERELGMFDVLARQAADLIERRTAEAALRESEARYRDIIESAKEYAIVSIDEDRLIASWDGGAERLLGYSESEAVGQSADMFFTPEDRAAGAPEREFQIAIEKGRAVNERWHMRKDGSRFWGSGFMNRASGRPGFVKIFRDRTEERSAEERQALLVEELNHRVKNTLAVVQSLAQQTFAGDRASPAARQAFEGRLQALSAAHNILTRELWESADLEDVVDDSLSVCHGRPDQLRSAGPSIRLEPRTAVTIAMALHELCTNAMKYGALSVETGRVDVSWTITEGEPSRLLIRWEETGGPEVEPPDKAGFGSRMIERALKAELKADVNVDYRREGLVCTIDSPLPPQANERKTSADAGR